MTQYGLIMEYGIYLIPVALGVLAYVTGMLDVMGTIAAVFFGVLVLSTGGLSYLLSLLLFLILGFLFTKYKYEYKSSIGLGAEEDAGGGRRTINPVIANGIIPIFMAVLQNPFLFVGSLSAALADTMATEIGSMYDRPVLITTGERVPPGTRGAISVLGELASVAGSLMMGASIIGLFALLNPEALQYPVVLMLIALVGGVIGCNVDSVLGASLRFLSKDEVNLLGTLTGAAVAVAIMAIIVGV